MIPLLLLHFTKVHFVVLDFLHFFFLVYQHSRAQFLSGFELPSQFKLDDLLIDVILVDVSLLQLQKALSFKFFGNWSVPYVLLLTFFLPNLLLSCLLAQSGVSQVLLVSKIIFFLSCTQHSLVSLLIHVPGVERELLLRKIISFFLITWLESVKR